MSSWTSARGAGRIGALLSSTTVPCTSRLEGGSWLGRSIATGQAADTHWLEAEERHIRSLVYRWLEHAEFEDRKGTRVAFEPDRQKLANIMDDAIAAIAHLGERLEPPAWFSTER